MSRYGTAGASIRESCRLEAATRDLSQAGLDTGAHVPDSTTVAPIVALLAAALAVALLVVLIARLKLNAFVALVIASLVAGAGAGLPLAPARARVPGWRRARRSASSRS